MNVGSVIAQLRHERRWTQETLAGMLFVSKDLISKWETGVRRPDYSAIERIAEVFGVEPDVIIEKDVWCGANVTILKGVRIGRGSIIAAGAVVLHDVPPYSIAGGIPARVLKCRWSKSQIIKHESLLYPLEERFSEEQIDSFVKKK